MNYKKESQFTNNASKRVFEEAYIDEDMPNESANPSTGVYMLRVPEMFATDLSQEKYQHWLEGKIMKTVKKFSKLFLPAFLQQRCLVFQLFQLA